MPTVWNAWLVNLSTSKRNHLEKGKFEHCVLNIWGSLCMEHFISSSALGAKLLAPSAALTGELCLQSRLHNVEDRWFPISGFCRLYRISKI